VRGSPAPALRSPQRQLLRGGADEVVVTIVGEEVADPDLVIPPATPNSMTLILG
jgi:hypothetical protein